MRDPRNKERFGSTIHKTAATERLHVKRPARGRAGENEYDNKNEVPETKRERVREICSLLPFNQLNECDMKLLEKIATAVFATMPWLGVAVAALVYCDDFRVGAAVACFCCICATLAWSTMSERVR